MNNPPPPNSLIHVHGLTSGFTSLLMKTKYVCHGLISLHVNFHDNRTKWTVTSNIKNYRWGEKEKSPTMQFGSKSRCVATLGATHFQAFQIFWPGFLDQDEDGPISRTKAGSAPPSRPRRLRRTFRDQGGDGATKKQFLGTTVETARLSRPKQTRRGFRDQWETARLSDQRGHGATFQSKAVAAQLSKPEGTRHDFPDKVEAARLSRSKRTRHDFP